MRNRDAQPPETEPLEIVQRFCKRVLRNAQRNIDRIEPDRLERRVVHQRAHAVSDRIADHSKDLRVLCDGVIAKLIAHAFKRYLTGSQFAFRVERAVGQRRSVPAAQDSTGPSHFAHAESGGRNAGSINELQHFDKVARRVGHRHNLDDVRIQLAQPLMNLLDVVGRFVEVVVADDPLCVSVARDFSGNIFFQIDVFDSRSDRGSQQGLSLLFRSPPSTAVFAPTAGDDNRCRTVFDQAAKIRQMRQPVQSQFDQRGALVGERPMLGHHHLVPGSSDGNTDHCSSGGYLE